MFAFAKIVYQWLKYISPEDAKLHKYLTRKIKKNSQLGILVIDFTSYLSFGL